MLCLIYFKENMAPLFCIQKEAQKQNFYLVQLLVKLLYILFNSFITVNLKKLLINIFFISCISFILLIKQISCYMEFDGKILKLEQMNRKKLNLAMFELNKYSINTVRTQRTKHLILLQQNKIALNIV